MTNYINVTITSDRTFLLECSPFRPLPWRSFPRTVRRELARLNKIGMLTNASVTTHSQVRVLVATRPYAATNSPGVADLRNSVAKTMARWWRVNPAEVGYSSTRIEF